jgi:3-oxoacyl-[acyl-carrier-protein] synthase II
MNRWGEAAMAKMYPLWMLMYLPNMIACHVGIAHDARGPNNTICEGDVSSLLAVIEAASVIQRGQADIMIAGGSSSRIGIAPALYRGMDRLSSRVDDPAGACRPFDAGRDGAVNGEGSAAFVLESEEHARHRGANILARLCGWGQSFARPENGRATESAVRRSIELALDKAALRADQVGHVNAHASGQVEEDVVEAQAIQRVLGDVPVTAPKSFFGDLGSSGGAMEMVASVLALQHGAVPVTLNYSQPDDRCPVRVVHGEPLAAQRATAVVLSQAPTGHAVALALDAG